MTRYDMNGKVALVAGATSEIDRLYDYLNNPVLTSL